jgi:ketosteroid isomerase-like protein
MTTRMNTKKADVIAVVEDLIAAENGMDATAAGRLLASDFAGITRGRGAEQDRAAMLVEVAHPKNEVRRRLEGEPWVRQSGNLAVSRSVVEILDGSPPVVTRFPNTHVLTREGSAWKCVAWQVTTLS